MQTLEVVKFLTQQPETLFRNISIILNIQVKIN